ncbi:hypothetical protein [Ruminococcus sp. XPD3002]|uniref:hypothetical protein n=1 Tax=Ruminococcus sp. XPD3002 TaxID=1452269 RepID=UPI00091718F6|nr:hypothetical protein SAMN04487832_12049 [Ruminococcus flavefaciens]HRU97267.1 hypothetical protein [Ruminococcus sp.]
MNWTKTVKDFAILLLLVLAALALISDIISLIRYHGSGSILSTLISLVKEICGYIIRIGALLVLAEISENVYAIRTGDKSSDK